MSSHAGDRFELVQIDLNELRWIGQALHIMDEALLKASYVLLDDIVRVQADEDEDDLLRYGEGRHHYADEYNFGPEHLARLPNEERPAYVARLVYTMGVVYEDDICPLLKALRDLRPPAICTSPALHKANAQHPSGSSTKTDETKDDD